MEDVEEDDGAYDNDDMDGMFADDYVNVQRQTAWRYEVMDVLAKDDPSVSKWEVADPYEVMGSAYDMCDTEEKDPYVCAVFLHSTGGAMDVCTEVSLKITMGDRAHINTMHVWEDRGEQAAHTCVRRGMCLNYTSSIERLQCTVI